jgi:GNAT superfamily N-acetyltransferase
MAAVYRGLFADALARGGRVRLAEDSQGVSAVALWSSPGNWRPSTLRGLQALPGILRALGLRGTLRLLRVSGRGSAVAVTSHPSEPHWYLAVVATADRSRGQGLGTLLMEDGLAHVDAHRMPAYLECEPHLEDWYRRFGFGVRQVLEIPEGILDGAVPGHQLGMWRIPSHA